MGFLTANRSAAFTAFAPLRLREWGGVDAYANLYNSNSEAA